MNNKIKVIVAGALALISSSVLAVQPVLTYEWQVEYGKATEFAEAFDALQKSKLGQDRTAQVQLQSTNFNGSNPATHRIVVLYPSLTEMDKWNAKLADSSDGAAFMSIANKVAKPVAQYITIPMKNWGTVSNKDTHWDSISMNVTDPAAALAGLDEMMTSAELKDFPGQLWLVQVLRGQAGAGGHMTHQMYIGYESLSELDAYSDKLYQTKAWQTYLGVASKSFTITNRETVNWLKAYEHNYSLEDFE
jgi:hypothetical protein